MSFQNVDQIEEAVLSGKIVHWGSAAYQVKRQASGKFVIECSLNRHAIALSYGPGKTPNGRLEEFFTGEAQ